jgi:hypothetical protein
MNMKLKVIFLFVVAISMQVMLTSCCGSIFGGSANTGGTSYHAITEIDATAVYDFESQESISEGDSINSDSLLIKIDFYTEKIAFDNEPNKFGFIQGAFACSEVPIVSLLDSNIKSFRIVSDQTYLNHPAGYDLAEYADIVPAFMQYSNNSLAIKAFVYNLNLSFNLYSGESYIIYLKSKPGNNLSHKLTIEIESEDGQVISSETQNFIWR